MAISYISSSTHLEGGKVKNKKLKRTISIHQIDSIMKCLVIGIVIIECGNIFFWMHPDWIQEIFESTQEYQQSNETENRTYLENKTDTVFTALSRKQRKEIYAQQQNYQQQFDQKRLTPCRLDGDCKEQGSFFMNFFQGLPSSIILIYNPLPESRYVCGKKILGGGTIQIPVEDFDHSCQKSYIHSPHPPPISGKGMTPIELYWNAPSDPFFTGFSDKKEQQTITTVPFECPIPCRTSGDFNIISIISIKETKWEITMSMEGEKAYKKTRVRSKGHRDDKYYAVTSFKSEIPIPYFSWTEYNINHPPVDFDKAIKGASFLARNCDSLNGRETLLKKLVDTELRVDSLSSCLHNADLPSTMRRGNKTAILERYLLHLAFENQRSDDYITEKMWGALAAGTLPVYFGAPNIKEHVPPHSAIFVDDFDSTKDLANYLIRLTKDRALYESYHAWRSQPIDPAFLEKYAFTKTHSTCRMCKWAYAKKHGFEWNHTTQEVQEPFIRHQTCLNELGLIDYPFKEFWLSGDGSSSVKVSNGDGTKTCDINDDNRYLTIGSYQRAVYDQDGITDFVIDPIGLGRFVLGPGKSILALETQILSDELLEKSNNEWWLQDNQSRFTLLTSQNATVTVTKQGTVHININTSIRIRVIMENIDTFHKKATKRENYFGELMKRDFFNPLLAYRIH